MEKGGNLPRSAIAQFMGCPTEYHLVGKLKDFLLSRREMPVEAILAIVQLVGGLDPYGANSLIYDIGDLMQSKRFAGGNDDEPLILHPPDDAIKDRSLDFYDQCQQFYTYCTAESRGEKRYWNEVVSPYIDRHVASIVQERRLMEQQGPQ